jgi:hypothetical protein
MRYNQIDAMYEKGTTRTTHGMIGRSCALMVDSVHQSKLWVIFIVVHSKLPKKQLLLSMPVISSDSSDSWWLLLPDCVMKAVILVLHWL